MHVDDIRKILMLQAFEEKNGDGDFFPEAEILSANSASGAPLDRRASRADEDAFLAKRADILLRRLRSRSPEATRWIDQIPERFPAGALAAGLGIIAALAGFFTNELGPEKRINILSFPLLGILLWSAIIYLREIFLFFRGRTAETIPVWLESLGERLKSRHEAFDAATDSFKNARLLFEKRWFLLSAPVPVARLKSLLHATAFILAASAVGGMYVKGLANEYRAVWESTFFHRRESTPPLP